MGEINTTEILIGSIRVTAAIFISLTFVGISNQAE